MIRQKNDSMMGTFYSVACYLMWGFFPLYFMLTPPASPLEVVAARVLFSLLFCLALLPLTRQVRPALKTLTSPRQMGLMALASVLIFANWLIFVIATTTGNVMESSLGYYINPIVSVALGVLFLGERLRRLQWAGLAVAALAVLVMVVFYGKVPWISLGLALSFGLYGLVKKQVGGIPAVVSLTLETLVLAPVALLLMVYFAQQGSLTLLKEGLGHFTVLALSGALTAIPLLFFAGAASRIPLSLIGMLQYIGPTLQFLVALALGEELNAGRWAGFLLVWVAALFFIADSLKTLKAHRRPVRLEEAG
ncbi:EamA family transporter RarD [Rothia nasimurium]|uniref:EamA family transporter RarD n=1 Tax=Rothia nasimurium TaxID=85336 RepID=UPI003BA3A8EC